MNSSIAIPTSTSSFHYLSNTSTSITNVVLVRHARTTYNELGRYQGSSDRSVLTQKGHQDAYDTGVALQNLKFDAIYTSPLTRVRQTTQEIVTALERSPYTVPSVCIESKLTEVCMSDWQGLSYQEVKQKYPNDYNCWQTTPHLFTRNQTDYPVVELFKQAEKFWQSVLDQYRGQTILVVAHGGTNRALISTAVGLSPQHYHSLQQSNCGISYLEFSQSSNFGQLKYLNVTEHLGETLPKLKAGKTGWRWILLSNQIPKDSLNNSDLEQLINQDLIDLCLTDGNLSSSVIADNLLKNNRKALSLSIDKTDLLDIWQKTISHRQNNNILATSELFTGIIIASEQFIGQFMEQTIKINTASDLSNHFIVIHYPYSENRSILQGILPVE